MLVPAHCICQGKGQSSVSKLFFGFQNQDVVKDALNEKGCDIMRTADAENAEKISGQLGSINRAWKDALGGMDKKLKEIAKLVDVWGDHNVVSKEAEAKMALLKDKVHSVDVAVIGLAQLKDLAPTVEVSL